MFKSCTIRALEEDDLPMVLVWRNHPDVRRFMLTQHEIDLLEHRRWFFLAQQDASRQQLIVMDAQEPIGFMQFNSISPGGISDWGFYLSPNAPKGSGQKLGWVSLNYAFNELGLHKVCGQAMTGNMASINFHKKLGFTLEGILRDQRRIEGKYHSLIYFGLLANEWQKK